MHKKKIFIVDDAASIRKNLKRLLSGLNNIEIIGEAGSIASAKSFLTNNKPDLTLLDLNLTDGSGYEILSFIKNSNNPHKVIILTNYSAKQYKQKSIKIGADYFFDKSTEFEKVIDLIKSL